MVSAGTGAVRTVSLVVLRAHLLNVTWYIFVRRVFKWTFAAVLLLRGVLTATNEPAGDAKSSYNTFVTGQSAKLFINFHLASTFSLKSLHPAEFVI